MRGKLSDAEIAQDELQLGGHGQAGSPDVLCGAPPQLHWAACPAVLLLPVCKEAGRQLQGNRAPSGYCDARRPSIRTHEKPCIPR